MSIFKCKMCGGALEIKDGESVAVCEYCGTKQTLPKLDDEKRANLYDRANHFRRNNEFDKAAGIYEQILNEDKTDAEAYWSLVLCRYGIEYVEDPATHKRVPTVNRAQYTSVFDDDNYRSALEYADAAQRTVYEQEAAAINEIQKGILAISQKEEPFDIFICYKETDNNGRRTPDSVLANDLYHQLTQEGYKVFFSRITLEDKLGTAYEPYIFAALNSAKVMVVLGTKPEYFNAVWVKNEWSRYLSLIKNGAKKVLIPAYRDMDPYDLPEEFSHLQALDMSKLGFMQDLIRGIGKILNTSEPHQPTQTQTVVVSENANVVPLLERVFLFLEDGKWQDANIYCEKVLDIDPKNAEAYVGKLMAELNVGKRQQLADCKEPFDDRENFAKVIRFGDEKTEAEMRGYIAHINERNENERLQNLYNKAVTYMINAASKVEYRSVANMFQNISGFKDSDILAEQCLEKAENCRKDEIYKDACRCMSKDNIADVQVGIRYFEQIRGWKESDKNIVECNRRIEELKEKQEADRKEAEREAEEARIAKEKFIKKAKRIAAIVVPSACAVVVFLIILFNVIIPYNKYNDKYNAAVSLMNDGKYEEAMDAFRSLDGYKDSKDKFRELGIKTLKSASVGDTVFFGTYEQDNNTSTGKENVEWLILAKEGDKILVISDKSLDCQQYNASENDVTWNSCSLREWLNGTFFNAAFSMEEQALILDTNVSADKNPEYDTNSGSSTTDKIFLLSINEVNKYFGSDEARKCVPTSYAEARGAYADNDYLKNGACFWWLRSPGGCQNNAAIVITDGSVYFLGDRVNDDDGAVRPAMWIDIGD